MSTLAASNLKNASSGSNNIVLATGGDTTITNNLTVSGTGNQSIAGTLQFNSGYGSVATAYGCRAWVNFNGTGTVAIRASGNVSSITDNGTGDYTVNFTTALADANYSAIITTSRDGVGQGNAINPPLSDTFAAGSCRLMTYGFGAYNFGDHQQTTVAIFR